MRRIIAITLMILITCSLSAAFVLDHDPIDHGVFSTPARLIDIEKKTPFGFEAEAVTSFDELIFLMDPVNGLRDSERYMADFLASQDASFWEDNQAFYDDLKLIDPMLPARGTNDELFERQMHDYFTGRYMSSAYGGGNRAIAFSRAMTNGIHPSGIDRTLSGDMDLSLSFYGGNIRNRRGWQAGTKLYLDSAASLLSNMTMNGHQYGNDLSAVVWADFGFSAWWIEDELSVGLTVTPEVYFRTTFSNADLINARIDDEILSIFANGSYHFGAGIGLTLGMMYRYSDELSFSLDLRNLPRLSGSIYFLATEVSDFRFHADRNIYITAPDLAFSVRWDHERWHVDAELGNIVSGLLDWAFIDGLPFRWQDILGFRVGYDLTDYLILSVSYEDGLLGLGFEKGDWKADILTRIDKLAIGVRCRYEM